MSVDNTVLNHDNLLGEADAVSLKISPLKQCVSIGVFTADCVPILLRNEDMALCIHAGWRGLANKIICKAIKASFTEYLGMEALIGPCAGYNDYKVGKEVIDEVYRPIFSPSGSEYLLDLQQTALTQINEISSDIKVISLSISTISDKSFHSYRRDAEQAGRNYSFLIV